MHNLADILQLKPKPWQWAGHEFLLTRPSVVDLITLTEINGRDTVEAKLWALYRHLHDAGGVALFSSADDARRCPAALGSAAIQAIEGLYGEGLD